MWPSITVQWVLLNVIPVVKVYVMMLFYNVRSNGKPMIYNFDSLHNKRAFSTLSAFPVCFLLRFFILFSAASCLGSSFWLIVLENVDCKQPNCPENSVWDTFSEASWTISSFWLSDKSLQLQLELGDSFEYTHYRDITVAINSIQ